MSVEEAWVQLDADLSWGVRRREALDDLTHPHTRRNMLSEIKVEQETAREAMLAVLDAAILDRPPSKSGACYRWERIRTRIEELGEKR